MDFQEILWLIREPRTGSSWLNIKLSKLLNRERNFLDNQAIGNLTDFFINRQQNINDYNQILSTHHFAAVKSLNNYKDPIVIRTLRKNKVEQFLSQYIGLHSELKFINYYEEEINIQPIVVPKKAAELFVKLCIENEIFWNAYASSYRNETVYYEDLLDGHNFTYLPIPKIGMNIDEDKILKKIPYNKKEIVINYSQIEKIFLDNLPYPNA